MRSLALIDRENEYLLYGFFFKKFGSAITRVMNFRQENFSLKAKRIPAKFLQCIWKCPFFSIETFLGSVDILLAPDWLIPPRHSGKLVVIVHDVIPFLHPEWYTPTMGDRIRRHITSALDRADMVVTISDSSRGDILRLRAVAAERVRTIPGTVDPIFDHAADLSGWESLKSRYGIKDRFILFVGMFEPRKNITGLCQAYGKLKKTMKSEHQLVLVGSKGWMYEDISEEISKGSPDDVIVTGYLPDEELALFYREADVFVYPSFYEGFGLPPLEAMACGTPVITSNSSSLPEVVGDAGIMVDPNDVDGLANAIYSVLSDANLRNEMSRKGLERAKLFSEGRMAREMLRIFEEVGKT